MAIDCFQNSKWIWVNDDRFEHNIWINLRQTFHLDKINASAVFYIAVDTDYVLWINGKFVALGSFTDFPQEKHWDEIEISEYLKAGENTICVLAYYQGYNTSRYQKGKPGVIFSVRNGSNVIDSNGTCKARMSEAYQNGQISVVTRQLGLNIIYHADKEDDWLSPEYDDQLWLDALEIGSALEGYWKCLKVRPLPKLILKSVKAEILFYGDVRNNILSTTPALEMSQADLKNISDDSSYSQGGKYKTKPGYDGFFAIYDLKDFYCGYFEIEIEADAGTIIDFAHGEHLDDGRVRCKIDDRNFADRYICRQGLQKWIMPMRKIGCRYIELHVKKSSSEVKVKKIAIINASYPVNNSGYFRCSDQLHERIEGISRKTLKVCMHEHFEDTPWREQALYSLDTRNQAICCYYAFGEYDFAKVSLDMLGKSLSLDGFLELSPPSKLEITIPSFSMIWICALRDYFLFSGDADFVSGYLDQIKFMIDIYLNRIDETGLMPNPVGSRYWNFIEWTSALSLHYDHENNANFQDLHCSNLNMFLIEAMEATSQICGWLEGNGFNYDRQIMDLKRALRKQFLVDRLTWINDKLEQKNKTFSQITQALASVTGVFDGIKKDEILVNMLTDPDLIPATLSMRYYVYKSLLDSTGSHAKKTISHLSSTWDKMLQSGAKTCWETILGADDFEGAGSLTHGWSAIPIYFYYAYLLGIQPLKPGFSEFLIHPVDGDFENAEGAVPTPQGDIKVMINKKEGRRIIKVDYPENLNPVLGSNLKKEWDINLNPYNFSNEMMVQDF